MKYVTLTLSLFFTMYALCLAQPQDSITVELERGIVTSELTQLRDSIDLSITVFTAHIEKAPLNKRKKLTVARRELIQLQDLVELDLDEISTTAKNAWTPHAIKRVRINTTTTRREYLRILALLQT